jgi:hypothetical protein
MIMGTYLAKTEGGGNIQRTRIFHENEQVSYAHVLDLWQHDQAFRNFFTHTLADATFEAFAWETPPVTQNTLSRAFEFVLINHPALLKPTDLAPFAQHFRDLEHEDEIAVFHNLGNDAVLIAPLPDEPIQAHAHLASFLRAASEPQKHALWKKVGQVMANRIGPDPIWLNTEGSGVAWLHIRLDSRPKYYRYAPYRKEPT